MKQVLINNREIYDNTAIEEGLRRKDYAFVLKVLQYIKYVRRSYKLIDSLKDEFEKGISQDAMLSYNYSLLTQKEFPLGELAIAKRSDYSYKYAFYFKKRFYLGEPAIATSARHSCNYATDIIKGRFFLGEKAISEDSYFAFTYARFAIEGRFELGEPIIARDAYRAYSYAMYVLEGRFALGEDLIMESDYRDLYMTECMCFASKIKYYFSKFLKRN